MDKMRDALAELGRLQGLIGSDRVKRCEVCGRDADRMVCRACWWQRQQQREVEAAEFDRCWRKVFARARDSGVLPDVDRRWLLANGCKDTVDALEERFKRLEQKAGGTGRRGRERGAGFGDGPGNS